MDDTEAEEEEDNATINIYLNTKYLWFYDTQEEQLG
jgi:hypothetical protein